MRRRPEPQGRRMRRTRFVGWTGFAAVIVPVLLLTLVLLASGQSTDRVIGVAGTVGGVAALALSQYATRRPPLRRVVFLAKSRSSFARNICRGLTEALADYSDVRVETHFPPSTVEDPLEWQRQQLRSLAFATAHAVVIIPAAEDHLLWRELAARIRSGALVVCIDTKPVNEVFLELGTEPPRFVGSDFMFGGRAIGTFMVEDLNGSPETTAVLALGPELSWPARERASWLLYQLALHGLLDRCRCVALPSWNTDDCAGLLLDSMNDALATGATSLVVYTGNDKLAAALDRAIRRTRMTDSVASIRLVGYDGTTTDDGVLMMSDLDHGVATIDAIPFEQGRAAGDFVQWAYAGEQPHFRKRIIPPALRRVQT